MFVNGCQRTHSQLYISYKLGGIIIVRNSFIQMSKLTNVRGRISYISSHARQENLYAVYETVGRIFWSNLAKCNQEEFKKSGTSGKCIEARELIIALPESFIDYPPNMVLRLFVEHFKNSYGTECIAALHHNKRKTNYHIHLIFSERRLLEQPIEKIATRNMFYDESGKHVRTKKEILDKNGQVRKRCKIISKGEVYERKIFTTKDERFKDERFLDEVKKLYTELINVYVLNDKQKLQVFDKNSVYLPTKKIGKNNPQGEQIKRNNEVRQQWNQTVDRALVSGVSEEKIMEVKQTEITDKIKQSVRRNGNQPTLFIRIIELAISVLELLIRKVLDVVVKQPERPKMSEGAAKYPRLQEIYDELNERNWAIHTEQKQLNLLELSLSELKGVFKAKERKEVQAQIEESKRKITNMTESLPHIVRGHGYKTVRNFMVEYNAARSENGVYEKEIAEWKRKYGPKEQLSGNDLIERMMEEWYRDHKQEQDEDRYIWKYGDRGAR